MKATRDQVWKAMETDPEFRAMYGSNAERDVVKPFVVAMAEVMKDLIDVPLNINSYSAARRMYLDYCRDNKLIDLLAEVSEEVRRMRREMERFDSFFYNVMQSEISDTVIDVVIFRITEEDLFRELGISDENLEKFRNGLLTIGDVLISQPILLTKMRKR